MGKERMSATSEERQAAPSMWLVVLALVPFGLGYFLSYLFRAANAVVAPDLVRDVSLSAGDLGVLTAAYLLAFALFQLPLGILLDTYGPRRVQAALVALTGFGALMFAYGQSAGVLMVARAIIGIGSAGGLMSSFKAVVLWVPEQRRALANSLVMSSGAIGLLTASTPMEWVVQAMGWRSTFVLIAVITFCVAATIFLVVPERKSATVPAPLRQQMREVADIYRDRTFLALLPLLAVTAGVHIAVQTLWVGPWFRDIAGFDRMGVANSLFVMALAFFAGILITGAAADWFSRRGVSLLTVMLGFMTIFFVSQVLIVAEVRGLDVLLWALFGMTGQVAILAYPWLSSYFGASRSGRANTAVNLPMFACAFLAQAAVGWVIDLFPPSTNGGYAPEAYRTAFGLLLALQVIAAVWFFANYARVSAAQQSIRMALQAK